MYIASELNHIEIVKSLISAYANLQISSIFGTTPLYMIKFYQYVGILEYLYLHQDYLMSSLISNDYFRAKVKETITRSKGIQSK